MNNVLLKVSLQYKIDNLIDSKRLTKTAFAKEIGVSRDTVYKFDENIKLSTIIKICKFFNIKLHELVDEEYLKNDAENGKLDIIKEESEVYDTINYKEKYLLALEKLNDANEKLLKMQEDCKKHK